MSNDQSKELAHIYSDISKLRVDIALCMERINHFAVEKKKEEKRKEKLLEQLDLLIKNQDKRDSEYKEMYTAYTKGVAIIKRLIILIVIFAFSIIFGQKSKIVEYIKGFF